ncbi:AcvB/VirJ family lysyl-phosphatidylglycerol hydrolase [Consotaella salsifontis]|uniref:Type IV secretory pathway, VirJ component n=1 Tax=Consotaella salsifontis TaxID=1365950 RepID=A0A1T4QJI9_9HYPH|nr:AcvB/VirJ family lysyl-phosphatidylglycerol hydrolase [Consotaella salsifontis]SKA03797.1 Type IV secretory pathway, VirJ component [Consotaella salsifontis]
MRSQRARPKMILVGLVAALLLPSGAMAEAPTSAPEPDAFTPDFLQQPVELLPDGKPLAGEVIVLSDGDGWTGPEEQLAERLRQAGQIVLGVDSRRYLAAIDAAPAEDDQDCAYLVSDLEGYSQLIQRRFGAADYKLPAVAGVGLGGTLALAIAAQTPDATIGRTLAVDPQEGLPLKKALCTPAPVHRTASGEAVYDLTPGRLPDPVEIVLTPGASDAGRAHAARLETRWPAIDIHNTDKDAFAAAFALLKPGKQGGESDGISSLPLAILDAPAKSDIMAIIYSGDGGWRDLDETIGEHLQAAGVPVVGVDSLRYFWSPKTPQKIAEDLQAIMDAYLARWNVKGVYLVGYSFGADILPSAYLALDDEHKKLVRRLSLLGFSREVDYQVSVSGWLGVGSGGRSTVEDLRQIPPAIVQCFYGADDDDTACPELADSGITLFKTEGGHHFDGDYEALAKDILK